MASNAPVYTRRSLLVADGPQAPGDRRSCVRCTSRRWTGKTCFCSPRSPCRAAGGKNSYLGATHSFALPPRLPACWTKRRSPHMRRVQGRAHTGSFRRCLLHIVRQADACGGRDDTADEILIYRTSVLFRITITIFVKVQMKPFPKSLTAMKRKKPIC